MHRSVLLLSLLALSACKGPPAPLAEIQAASFPVIPLEESLAALEASFDHFAAVPRVVALLPPRCEVCATGLAAVRNNLLEAFPGRGLHVFIVLAAGERCDSCGTTALERLSDPRVTIFVDRQGVAARAFARGLLPVAAASDMFLFYPRGARWTDTPTAPRDLPSVDTARGDSPRALLPRAGDWWHRMGRIAPDRHCSIEQLDAALQSTMARLLLENSVAHQ